MEHLLKEVETLSDADLLQLMTSQALAACVQGYMLEIQRMREEIDAYLLAPLAAPLPPPEKVTAACQEGSPASCQVVALQPASLSPD